ncbi:hypothetical protein HMN09_01096900 [Mycena chlorophos]|uniref:SH3 domain-containing protein n=1 Tax=Mycena chlorophos TaxID=658473 RepID=A0A8H6SCM4_MYCCL|nr:hypothetical protein HMN09_01096900 [Mycena chlorophos]
MTHDALPASPTLPSSFSHLLPQPLGVRLSFRSLRRSRSFPSFDDTTTAKNMTVNTNHRMMRARRQVTEATATGTTATEKTTPSASEVVDHAAATTPPNTVITYSNGTLSKDLEIIVAILGVLILCGVGFCLFRRHRRKQMASSSQGSAIDFRDKTQSFDNRQFATIEKPTAVYFPGFAEEDMNAGWVPQSRQQVEANTKKAKTSKRKQAPPAFPSPSARSPPPSYRPDSAASIASQIPLPPSPPTQKLGPVIPPTPPTPPAKKKPNPFSLAPHDQALDMPPIPSAVLSPARSESFAAHQSMAFARTNAAPAPERLMTVVNPFVPTMDDELPITVGETIRVLEEFHDGWGLVQRMGRGDAPKGVVPMTCLAEREQKFMPNRRL